MATSKERMAGETQPPHRGETPQARRPMPLEDRAKIFAPFDPLAGFRDALRDVEREVEEAAENGMSRP